MDRRQICTEVKGTVAYLAAQDNSSAAVCHGVPRFAAGALPRGCESHEISCCRNETDESSINNFVSSVILGRCIEYDGQVPNS